MKKGLFRGKGRKIEPILWVVFVIMFIYALTLTTPLYFMLVNSIKRIDDFLQNGAWKFPKMFWWKNYKDAIHLTSGKVTFVGMYVNSFIFTVATTLITATTSTMMAYALARFRFYGSEVLVTLAIGSLVLPDFGSGIVVYKWFVQLNLIDTWALLIRYTTPFGLPFLVMYGFFKTVAGTYAEAARIDGAGEWRVFVQICLPMGAGALGSIMVVLFMNGWNDYYTPYMYMPNLKTLALGLQELTATVSQLDKPKLFAGMVLAMTPIVVMFVCMRDQIIKNTAIGGIKG